MWGQSPSWLSRRHETTDRASVGRLAASVAEYAPDGGWLTVADDTWVDLLTGDRLTLSVYRCVGGRWVHFSGTTIAALEG